MSQSLSLANWMVGLHCHIRSSHFTETSESTDQGISKDYPGTSKKVWCSNFTSEFLQILHTANHHWVCTSSVGCLPGTVNLYDSLFHDIIANEVEEQLKDVMASKLTGINIVEQQGNGSACSVFSIAFATCMVYGRDPGIVTFDVTQMRPHLSQALKLEFQV